MAEVILVHGSCHGAWCWRDITPRLAAMGHDVSAIDLPGHGQDTTPISDVTLQRYGEAIVERIKGRAVLVGHSMGGYPISQAAMIAPDKIAKLIYVCAYVPKTGMSLADRRREAPYQPLEGAIDVAPDRTSFTFAPDHIHRALYHDCPEGTLEFARARLTPQPILPQETPFGDTRRIRDIARAYVRCLDDRTIAPAFQITMSAHWPEAEIAEMACAHSPFFADPDGLSAHIDRFIGE